MKAIIIGVGDELVTGKTVNTNSAYLAEQLALHGIESIAHWTIGDCVEAIASAISSAAQQADVVLVSGGLGPTSDDLTRRGLAAAMGDAELVLDTTCLERIEDFFRRRGRQMPPANRIQAMFPAGAQPLENQVGTAPGIAAKVGGSTVFAVPGVPHEMKWMFHNAVVPRLPRSGVVVLTHVVHTFGTGESDVARMILDLMKRGGPTSVGTTVAAGMVSVRIIVRSLSGDEARREIARVAGEIRSRLGDLVIGEGEATMASIVGDLLRRRRQTLATAESCTGGLVGQMITAVPGASDYYLGGIVSYANQAKCGELGVPADVLAAHGAVSEPVAAAMARGCRQRLRSDWAISTTGIAGPTGGSDEKPVGLVYTGLSGPGGTTVSRHLFPGTREHIRERAATAVLNQLRLAIKQ